MSSGATNFRCGRPFPISKPAVSTVVRLHLHVELFFTDGALHRRRPEALSPSLHLCGPRVVHVTSARRTDERTLGRRIRRHRTRVGPTSLGVPRCVSRGEPGRTLAGACARSRSPFQCRPTSRGWGNAPRRRRPRRHPIGVRRRSATTRCDDPVWRRVPALGQNGLGREAPRYTVAFTCDGRLVRSIPASACGGSTEAISPIGLGV